MLDQVRTSCRNLLLKLLVPRRTTKDFLHVRQGPGVTFSLCPSSILTGPLLFLQKGSYDSPSQNPVRTLYEKFITKKYCSVAYCKKEDIDIPRRPCPPHRVLGVMLTSVTQTQKRSKFDTQAQKK